MERMKINKEIEARLWELFFVKGITLKIILEILQEEFSISLYSGREYLTQVVKNYPHKITEVEMAKEDIKKEYEYVVMKYDVNGKFLTSSSHDNFRDAVKAVRSWIAPTFMPYKNDYDVCQATLLKTDKEGHIIKFLYSTIKEEV